MYIQFFSFNQLSPSHADHILYLTEFGGMSTINYKIQIKAMAYSQLRQKTIFLRKKVATNEPS